jgi:Cd2+/Zn2+-exporting ATPase/Cu+-exporting ATPase
VLERAEKEGVSYARAAKFHYLVGRGISGTVGGKPAVVGNDALMAAHGIDPSGLSKDRERLESEGKTVLVVAKGGEAIGLIAVSDILRKDVAKALDELRALGIGRIVLITGDNERVAAAAAKYCGITEYRANQLPHDKFGYVKELQKEGRRVLMIGDGVNDAPAIAQADVGIAMGSGTDVSIETSDIVLMRDEWGQVPVAVRISRKAFSTIKQNIAVGVVFNVLGISLASAGILTPIFAAMAQSLPDVMVFLNSSRLLFLKKGR